MGKRLREVVADRVEARYGHGSEMDFIEVDLEILEAVEERVAALEARLALLEKRDEPDGAVHFSYGDGGGI